MGKAMANGFPIAALAGKRRSDGSVQHQSGGDVFFAGTYNGHAGSVAAALATIEELETARSTSISSALGDRMRDGLQKIVDHLDLVWTVAGFGSVYTLYFMDGPVENYTDLLRNDARSLCRIPAGAARSGHFRDADEPEAQPHQLQPHRGRYRPHPGSCRGGAAQAVEVVARRSSGNEGRTRGSMIIDVHTPHLPLSGIGAGRARSRSMLPGGPIRARSNKPTWAEYMEALAPVDRAIVFNIASDPRDGEPDDGGLHLPDAAGQRRYRRLRARPPGKVHRVPDRASASIRMRSRRSSGPPAISGCAASSSDPNYQNFDPLGPEAFAVFKRAEELGLPILFHQGTSPVRFADLDFAHPRHMDRVATAFPDLKMIMAHMGHPWQIDCCVVIRKHPNVYADISGELLPSLVLLQRHAAGTEWAVSTSCCSGPTTRSPPRRKRSTPSAGSTTRSPAPRCPACRWTSMEKILHRNSLELLGLPH